MTSENSRPLLVIDMVVDPICPWCYIGFRGLDWATMALSFTHQLEVRYRPYRLDPSTPIAGVDRKSTLESKFPDPNHRAEMAAALAEAMQDVGLSFDLECPKRIPNTVDAHRLMRWAQMEDCQKPVLAQLFEAYWRHGEDLGQADVLAQVAERGGMDGEEVLARLATDEDRQAVIEEAAAFRDGGVSGVPTYIVNEQTGFAGALPKAQLQVTLSQLVSEVGPMEAPTPDA